MSPDTPPPTTTACSDAGGTSNFGTDQPSLRLTVLATDGQSVDVTVTRVHARGPDGREWQTVWLTPATGAMVIPWMELAAG